MTMSRQELDETLVDYLFDELSDEEAKRFEAEVAGHPDLEAEVRAHRRTRERCAELPQRTMSPDVMSAVMREARAAVAVQEDKESWFEALLSALMQPAMATAGIVLLLGGVSASLLFTEEAGHVPEVFASKVDPSMEVTPGAAWRVSWTSGFKASQRSTARF